MRLLNKSLVLLVLITFFSATNLAIFQSKANASTTYFWYRYSVNSGYKYTASNGSRFFEGSSPIGFSVSGYANLNPNTGQWSVSSGWDDSSHYVQVTHISSMYEDDWNGIIRVGEIVYQYNRGGGYKYYYKVSVSSSYVSEKGAYIDSVSSNGRYDYPDNGISGGYWYVYAGANSTPVISILSPSDYQSYRFYQIPQFKFNVYDIDYNSLQTLIQYYNGTDWVVVDNKTSLSHGSQVVYDLTSTFWSSLPTNQWLPFWLGVNDGYGWVAQTIYIMKVNNAPMISWLSPADNSTYRSDESPSVSFRVNDADGDTMTATLYYFNGSQWLVANQASGLVNNQTAYLSVPNNIWRTVPFTTGYPFLVQVSDGAVTVNSSQNQLIRINTAPTLSVTKPINNEIMFSGYLPSTWTAADIDNQNLNLRIYTDTPNIINGGVLFNGSIGTPPYSNNNLFKVWFPLGNHNLHYELSDGFTTTTVSRVIKIDEMANIRISSDPTFYINKLSVEKSDYYFDKINSALETNISLFNINDNPVNLPFTSNVAGVENVTGDTDYRNNGNRLYNSGEFDPVKITDWIDIKANNPDSPIIKVIPVGTNIVLKDIIFSDEDKNYVTLNPNKGKDRQFQLLHYPQVYDNADSEIASNGTWYVDTSWNTFDGNPVIRDGQDIKLLISKAGKFTVNAKEWDNVYNPANVNFNKQTDIKTIDYYAHRYPVAKILYTQNLNQTINLSSGSYDLDFESRADKGIQQTIWEYRRLDYSDNLILDWTPIASLNSFAPDINFRTEVRLTVKDYGATINLNNDGELTAIDYLMIDAIGRPPEADFNFKVGTSLPASVMANGEVYKGNAGHETIQLDDSPTTWNDIFAPSSNNRAVTYNPTQAALNNSVSSSSNLSTTMTATNKYGLSDSVSKSVNVKDVYILNNSDSKAKKGSNVNFKADLRSNSIMDKWGNFRVTLTCASLGLNEYIMTNTLSTAYEFSQIMPNIAGQTMGYSIKVYSKRTGELLSQGNYSMIINSPPTVSIIGTRPTIVYEGDTVYVSYQPDDPDQDELTVNFSLRRNGTEIWTSSDNISPAGGVYVRQEKLMQNNITAGNYVIEITVSDPYGESASASYNFTPNLLSITGYVNHTSLWNDHRIEYNNSKNGNSSFPRVYADFFPGEKFVLDADTTVIDNSRVGEDNLRAVSVTCQLIGYSFNANMSTADTNNWTGSIWDEIMMTWDDRSLLFRFTVTYSNGATKTNDVTVNIADDEYWRQHRRF